MTVTRTPVMKFTSELDAFETRVENFCRKATPELLVRLINEATAFIEKQAEDSNPETFRHDGWTHLNNATSAINHAARALKNRI